MQAPQGPQPQYIIQCAPGAQLQRAVVSVGQAQVAYPQRGPTHLAPTQQHFQQVYIQPVTTQRADVFPNYKWRTSQILGALHIVLGLLCIAFNGGAMAVNAFLAIVAHGIWGGLFFVITGIFGILSSQQKNYCMISANLGMSITSCLIASCGSIMCIIGADYDSYWYSWKEERVALNAMLSIFFFAELAISIWSSVISGIICGPGGDCSGTGCQCYGCDECYGQPQQVQHVIQPGGQAPQLMPFNQGMVAPTLAPGMAVSVPAATVAPAQNEFTNSSADTNADNKDHSAPPSYEQIA